MGIMNQEDLQAFNNMTAATDATSVDLFGENKAESWTDEEMHTALDIAGLLPIVGNAADAFNAATYAMDGEFGNAALSLTALVPIVGQMATVNKLAKESGEKMITLYRGYPKWFPGSMVKKGNFISGQTSTSLRASREGIDYELYTTLDKNVADMYAGKSFIKSNNKSGVVLQFEVPESWFKKHAKTYINVDELIKSGGKSIFGDKATARFIGGLPKEFLTKVIK